MQEFDFSMYDYERPKTNVIPFIPKEEREKIRKKRQGIKEMLAKYSKYRRVEK
ncbi:hypothetical protein [Bacillus sp. SG-1]|uniref:hypothetical protein n=1 Tax=Bacillus sp. SG-1 TaxID=161544 RepID=UPI0002FDE587|nr:hypothetical protein [Bacillus sp. SG-1]